MTDINIITTTFSQYQFDIDDWASVETESGTEYVKILDRARDAAEFDADTDAASAVYSVRRIHMEGSTPAVEEAVYSEADLSQFDSHTEQVFSMWDDVTNLSEEQMEMWDEHPCSDAAVDDGENTRDETLMLMGQAPDGWNEDSFRVANEHLAYVMDAMEEEMPDDAMSGGEGSCPTRWAVKLLNRGVNPFDSMPDGNPEFTEEDADAGLVYNDDGDAVEFSFAMSSLHEESTDSFNEYGIKENRSDSGELESVDAIYEAMEPGPPKDRNGVRITADFLRKVGAKDYDSQPPYLMDHQHDTLSHIGFVKDVWFNETTEKLMVKARTYNTGADTHDEIINRLTHEPPTITDGSLGFGQSYTAITNDDGEKEFVDGRVQEFSTTPFPGGYDEGGLRASGSD